VVEVRAIDVKYDEVEVEAALELEVDVAAVVVTAAILTAAAADEAAAEAVEAAAETVEAALAVDNLTETPHTDRSCASKSRFSTPTSRFWLAAAVVLGFMLAALEAAAPVMEALATVETAAEIEAI